MLEVVSWLFLGLIVGWIFALIPEKNIQHGAGLEIITGMIGAVVGGVGALRLFNGTADSFSENSLLGAIIGAVGIIAVVKFQHVKRGDE